MKHFVVNPDRFVFEGIRGVTERDIELMFSPDPSIGDEVVFIEATDLAALAVEAGVFPSRGTARKNGLGGPIPWGLHLLGTKKHRFWVWCPCNDQGTPTFNPSMDLTERWFNSR